MEQPEAILVINLFIQLYLYRIIFLAEKCPQKKSLRRQFAQTKTKQQQTNNSISHAAWDMKHMASTLPLECFQKNFTRGSFEGDAPCFLGDPHVVILRGEEMHFLNCATKQQRSCCTISPGVMCLD